MITRLILFSLIGLSGLIIDFSITWILKEKAQINKFIANSIGFICAATSNFFLNRIFTFHSVDPDILHQYFGWLLIVIAGLIINNLIIYAIHSRLKYNFYVAKVLATIIVVAWNFTMSCFFVFTK